MNTISALVQHMKKSLQISHVEKLKAIVNYPSIFTRFKQNFVMKSAPRFGVMRAREFIMKDAYSFHTNIASLQKTYQIMHQTYQRIFSRLGLNFRAVTADSGTMGGSSSHEFHVLADSGEDAIAFCPNSDYAVNIELAEALPPQNVQEAPQEVMKKVATPDQKTCAEVANFLNRPIEDTVKAIAVTANNKFFLLLLRGDHQINELKVRKIPLLANYELANEDEIIKYTGSLPGYIGPLGLESYVIADHAVIEMKNIICGANEEGFHLTGVNFNRDIKLPDYIYDIRNVVSGDLSPDGKGKLEICRGIEIGHIFQLRTKYSETMKAGFLNKAGQTQAVEMGCYGIGVSRIVAAAIEQSHDAQGIVFPLTIAPFQLVIIPIGLQKSTLVKTETNKLYCELTAAKIEVLLDDRDERPGVMFADMELIGIPHRVVVSERGLKNATIEYQGRQDKESQAVPLQEIKSFITSKLCDS